LIIGGGITGAGIALDATTRGLKTALIEKTDFAFGTSSRSTKLIHGGLRYLKQLEFGLVKEVGSERAVVHRLAPHLVIPEKMLLPLYEKRGLGSTLTSIGLKLYDWLAGVKPEDQRKMLTQKQTLRQEPLLNPKEVKGGAIYAEYRTDDARLTVEIIKSASDHGAVIANYCEALNFVYDDQKIGAVDVFDISGSTDFTIKSKAIVNATGPWVDLLREKDKSKTGKHLHLTKGVHIVVPHNKLPVTQSIYFDVGDGRMIFAIPRGRVTYVGTTDTNYPGNIDDVHTEKTDARYLIDAVNSTFKDINLDLDDIESSWAGLRPLINEEGKSASELSRKDEIFESPSGLISIAGGKLTGYRKMAERVVDLVVKRNFDERKLKSCLTGSILLASSDFLNYDQVKEYQKIIFEELKLYDLQRHADLLVSSFGKQTDEILRYFEMLGGNNHDHDHEIRLVKALLQYCIEKEMVKTATDFFVRRTGTLYFDLPLLRKITEPCLQSMANHFQWNQTRVNNERKEMERLIDLAYRF
jgi:glycerol-3-phosphate dehydrogenase